MNSARIVCNPEIMLGKPTIAGTRLTVELILEEMAHGTTIPQLLEMYPRLTRDGIKAALLFAVKAVRIDAPYSFALATA